MLNSPTKEPQVAETMLAFNKAIGNKSLRFRGGLLGIAHTTVEDWESGEYLPKFENLQSMRSQVLAALNCIDNLIVDIGANGERPEGPVTQLRNPEFVITPQ